MQFSIRTRIRYFLSGQSSLCLNDRAMIIQAANMAKTIQDASECLKKAPAKTKAVGTSAPVWLKTVLKSALAPKFQETPQSSATYEIVRRSSKSATTGHIRPRMNAISASRNRHRMRQIFFKTVSGIRCI